MLHIITSNAGPPVQIIHPSRWNAFRLRLNAFHDALSFTRAELESPRVHLVQGYLAHKKLTTP